MDKILFVTWQRRDAIGIVDEAVKEELKKVTDNFDFLELYEKGETKSIVIKNYLKNMFLLLKTVCKYKKIYFSRENPFVIIVRMFFWKKPLYMTVHHVEDYRGKSIIGKLMFKVTTHFIAISEFTKKQLMTYGVVEEKISVNYNGISKDYFPEKIDNFIDYSYILYVGTEVLRKNLSSLLTAFSSLKKEYPDLKLVKIGKAGDKQVENDFNSVIKQLHLQHDIILKRDFITNEELRKRYSNAVCYVSVATLEGFGLTIPEAMACGCPVVASKIGPFEEICGTSQILVDPMDIEAIARGLEKYIVNKDFRKKMIDEGIMLAKKFNWEKNVQQLVTILS